MGSSSGSSPNLDLLRSVAVLLVLAAHLLIFLGVEPRGAINPFDLGHLGVLFFFVHTSLVLMMSLDRQSERFQGSQLYLGFYLRRFFRIYPLAFVVVLTLALLRIPSAALSEGSFEMTYKGTAQLLANLFLVQNLTYHGDFLGPLWSLPIEIQMYFFLPFLFVWAKKGGSVRTIFLVWCAAVVLAALQPSISGRLDLLLYAPCFLPGILAFRLLAGTPRRWPAAFWPVAIAGLIGVYLLLGLLDPLMESLDPRRGKGVEEAKGWVVCLILGWLVPRFRDISSSWLRRVSGWGAKYSYGIYLTHFFCIWLAFIRLDFLPPAMQWAVFVAVLVGLPYTLFHAIESPLNHLGIRLAERLRSHRAIHATAH